MDGLTPFWPPYLPTTMGMLLPCGTSKFEVVRWFKLHLLEKTTQLWGQFLLPSTSIPRISLTWRVLNLGGGLSSSNSMRCRTMGMLRYRCITPHQTRRLRKEVTQRRGSVTDTSGCPVDKSEDKPFIWASAAVIQVRPPYTSTGLNMEAYRRSLALSPRGLRRASSGSNVFLAGRNDAFAPR